MSSLLKLRTAFLANSWLTKRSDAWYTSVDYTLNDGLHHAHLNLIIFGGISELEIELPKRWAQVASRLGIAARSDQQHVEEAQDTQRVIEYVCRGLMKRSKPQDPGRTLGDAFYGASELGDADDAELWADAEGFARGVVPRLTGRGGGLRHPEPFQDEKSPQETVQRPPRGFTALSLIRFDFMGLSSAEKARWLGVSRQRVWQLQKERRGWPRHRTPIIETWNEPA